MAHSIGRWNVNKKFWPKENGQTAVIIAVLLIVLLAVAGLAIDGGTAYLGRRRMQNAADSAALAGARRLAQAMCDRETPSVTDAAIFSEVVSYAQGNGVPVDGGAVVAHYVQFDANDNVVEFSPAVVVGSGTVPNGAVGVIVTPTITQSTYFLGLIGQPTSGASAQATAVTGPPLLVGGMRPFGVPLETVAALGDGDQFAISFDQNGGTVSFAGQTAQHRGWMNMDYAWNQGEDPNWPRARDQSADANTIATWVTNGWDGTLYADCPWDEGCRFGDYIHAKPGKMASGLHAVDDLAGQVIYAPVFDVSVDCSTQVPAPKPACPHQGSGYVYHVVGFVGVRIIDATNDTINMELTETILGQGQASPNPGYQSQEGVPNGCNLKTLVVSLWE
jgi:Flp pilus assembly protein TadG